MKMDDVGAVLANVPHHAGTYWGAGDSHRDVNPGYGNSVDHAVLAVPAITGHQHAHVHRFAQSLAKRLDVGLDAAEVRPIELANVQDALFLYRTKVVPERFKVIAAVGKLVEISRRRRFVKSINSNSEIWPSETVKAGPRPLYQSIIPSILKRS